MWYQDMHTRTRGLQRQPSIILNYSFLFVSFVHRLLIISTDEHATGARQTGPAAEGEQKLRG